jgi:hypothetical protein
LWRNDSAERFLANRAFWNYVGEPEVTREPWEFDPKNPEQSLLALKQLYVIAQLVTELGFSKPPPFGMEILQGKRGGYG